MPGDSTVKAILDECLSIPHDRPQNQFEIPSMVLWYIRLIWRNQFKVSLSWSDGWLPSWHVGWKRWYTVVSLGLLLLPGSAAYLGENWNRWTRKAKVRIMLIMRQMRSAHWTEAYQLAVDIVQNLYTYIFSMNYCDLLICKNALKMTDNSVTNCLLPVNCVTPDWFFQQKTNLMVWMNLRSGFLMLFSYTKFD